jgi:hypothetical protein
MIQGKGMGFVLMTVFGFGVLFPQWTVASGPVRGEYK